MKTSHSSVVVSNILYSSPAMAQCFPADKTPKDNLVEIVSKIRRSQVSVRLLSKIFARLSQASRRWKEFVDAYINYAFNKSVEKVFEEFKRGFFKVCNREGVDFFQPEE
ncbi:unnamed protein product [Arctogadus glacialis]